ncbi:hypothetical protein M9H77_33220 [Catharanthus roseus]|uniref:Uncharacterized protein n=1 Tax=Catharanthus roseus TaxID=4058 RepID=A0ACB9ZL97_CATRO|nr:hypothetical protein M9H77_33220 [Catharanthus roseus]
MGFPSLNYSEVPKLFVHCLSFLDYIKNLLISLINFLSISDFLRPSEFHLHESPSIHLNQPPIAAILIREFLPVVKFSDLIADAAGGDLPENCAVCLHDFEGGDEEIRCLKNCKHIFHRNCLDRWMDHHQITCPLCRTSFVPSDLEDEFNQRLCDWDASEESI